MKLLVYALCLCLALADDAVEVKVVGVEHSADPDDARSGHHGSHSHGGDHSGHSGRALDRCEGLEMDAVTVDEKGVPIFFRGEHFFLGFHGDARMNNESFHDVNSSHHVAHVDAAFHMHHADSELNHHVLIFDDDQVYAFHDHKLADGYPKKVAEAFPGVPGKLSAAVECPQSACEEDSVLFFSDHKVFKYNLKNNTVEEKHFDNLANCTSALRFMDHFYCFKGHEFTRFDPKTGEAHKPLEVRGFFMKCASYGNDSDHTERERCSRVQLDAITSDHGGNLYAFRGHHFSRRAENNDTFTAGAIEHLFADVHDSVDAAFSYNDKIHFIKGQTVHIYDDEEPHALNDTKTLKEVLGLEESVDATFVCDDDHDDLVHVIRGNKLVDVNLKAEERVPLNERPLSALFEKVDAAKCDKTGVRVFVGNHFYHFESLAVMETARALPEQHRISVELFGCDH